MLNNNVGTPRNNSSYCQGITRPLVRARSVRVGVGFRVPNSGSNVMGKFEPLGSTLIPPFDKKGETVMRPTVTITLTVQTVCLGSRKLLLRDWISINGQFNVKSLSCKVSEKGDHETMDWIFTKVVNLCGSSLYCITILHVRDLTLTVPRLGPRSRTIDTLHWNPLS